MDAVEGAASGDGMCELAREFNASVSVPINCVEPAVGHADLGDGSDQLPGHGDAGQHHDAGRSLRDSDSGSAYQPSERRAW